MSTIYKHPLVSIITVNFNQAKLTGDFLTSIGQITYPNVEVIVVDNASSEPEIDILRQLFQHVIFIQSSVNTGFAGGNNLGVEAATGEYLLFINNDTEVEKNFLESLVSCIQADASIGMVSPKIKYYYNKNIIQYAGGKSINPFTGRGKFIGSGLPDSKTYHQTCPTQLIHGAAMLVSRKLINTIGLMEESFFLYYEELDWCERAKKSGFTLYYVGESTVYHKESLSVGRNSPLKIYYLTRNRLLFAKRNYNTLQLWISIVFFLLLAVPKTILLYALKGQCSFIVAFVKGILWHVQSKEKSVLGNKSNCISVNRSMLIQKEIFSKTK